jgi:TPP-dependent pyruvate/acetoin dehydrogenase alpha subunit
VQRCPLVVIVENNQWAYSTPTRLQTAAKSFVDKAPGYGSRASRWTATTCSPSTAPRAARWTAPAPGEGVTLIEVMTYRRRGHAQHDNQSYPAEIERWASTNDPLDRYGRRWSRTAGHRGELSAIDAEVDARAGRRRRRGRASPLPEPEEALTDVYADGPVNAPWTRLDPVDPTRA